jgi:alkylated DNA repair dioxygenase AlkB
MDLFDQVQGQPHNLLSSDGDVRYYGRVIPIAKADQYLEGLLESIDWKNDEAIIYGRHILTKQKVAWYGDKPYAYTYSRTTKHALPWTEELLQLKTLAEQETGANYNSCLLNLYHSGEEGMAWHSDGELDLERNGSIASLSLGAERKFAFKHKRSKQTSEQILENGSLLVMAGETQSHWLHRLPPTKKVLTPRVNLTFRQMRDKSGNSLA